MAKGEKAKVDKEVQGLGVRDDTANPPCVGHAV